MRFYLAAMLLVLLGCKSRGFDSKANSKTVYFPDLKLQSGDVLISFQLRFSEPWIPDTLPRDGAVKIVFCSRFLSNEKTCVFPEPIEEWMRGYFALKNRREALFMFSLKDVFEKVFNKKDLSGLYRVW
jgi:hypothetical protein